jgi:hypothetical protein
MSLAITYKRLLPIVNSIDKTIVCNSVVDNLNGTYTFVCHNTKWLTVGYNVTIGLNTYLIADFVCNESITVSGNTIPLVLTFDAYEPIFKHGTIKQVASELNMILDFKQRTPLIFLHEVNDDKIHLDVLDNVDNDAECTLYFLTSANFQDWNQIDGDDKGVQPMRNLINEFIKALSVSQFVNDLTGIGSVKNYNIFGNQDNNGATKNIFSEPLAGCRLKINISFLKDCDCCDVNILDNRPAPAYVYDTLGNILAILYSNEFYISTGGSCADVTIKDKDTGAIITTIASGGEYKVQQFEGVRNDLTGTLTIISPIT